MVEMIITFIVVSMSNYIIYGIAYRKGRISAFKESKDVVDEVLKKNNITKK